MRPLSRLTHPSPPPPPLQFFLKGVWGRLFFLKKSFPHILFLCFFVLSPPPAHAGGGGGGQIVYDPTNHVTNLLQAVRLASQLANQASMIKHQLTNLLSFRGEFEEILPFFGALGGND